MACSSSPSSCWSSESASIARVSAATDSSGRLASCSAAPSSAATSGSSPAAARCSAAASYCADWSSTAPSSRMTARSSSGVGGSRSARRRWLSATSVAPRRRALAAASRRTRTASGSPAGSPSCRWIATRSASAPASVSSCAARRVPPRPVPGGELRVHRLAHSGCDEREPPPAARRQFVARGQDRGLLQRVGGAARGVGVQFGQRRRQGRFGAVAEDHDRAGERGRRRGEAAQAGERGAAHRARGLALDEAPRWRRSARAWPARAGARRAGTGCRRSPGRRRR